jgi:four helix bundle protein
MKKGEILSRRLKIFAVDVSVYCDRIQIDNLGKVLALQMVKAATSVSLNHAEARVAASKRDFIHKLRIAQKEIQEVKTGLEILQLSGKYPDSEALEKIIQEANEIASMLYVSIRTTQNRIDNKA